MSAAGRGWGWGWGGWGGGGGGRRGKRRREEEARRRGTCRAATRCRAQPPLPGPGRWCRAATPSPPALAPRYDANNPAHVKAKKQIEEGDGLPDMTDCLECDKALVEVGFNMVESRDTAVRTSLWRWQRSRWA